MLTLWIGRDSTNFPKTRLKLTKTNSSNKCLIPADNEGSNAMFRNILKGHNRDNFWYQTFRSCWSGAHFCFVPLATFSLSCWFWRPQILNTMLNFVFLSCRSIKSGCLSLEGIFYCPPWFSVKKWNCGQPELPIQEIVNVRKVSRWLSKLFHFGTENW